MHYIFIAICHITIKNSILVKPILTINQKIIISIIEKKTAELILMHPIMHQSKPVNHYIQ